MTGLDAHVVVSRSDGFGIDARLAITPGTTVALLGPNGAGKSTLVAALAGLVPLNGGRIMLNDAVLDEPDSGAFVPPSDRRIGVVFQQRLLFEHLSVTENVAFGLRSRGVAKEAARERADAWLARLGVAGLAARRPGDLSGGQAQLVALARALASEPELLLLDEPLSALDVGARREVRAALGEHLSEFAGPRLLITHDPTEAFLLADEVTVMEHGSVTQRGTPDEIRLRPRSRYAADLAGLNFLRGQASNSTVRIGEHVLQLADEAEGGVIVTIHPTAIAVHRDRPGGSPRNAWETTVVRVEPMGRRVRLLTAGPLPLTVEVTESARAELGLEPGSRVWISVKATEISADQEDDAPIAR